MSPKVSIRSRYRGCLLGLAVGDALGAAVEFMMPGTFAPLTGMKGGGPHGLKPGQWTDDTSMALCLALSLVETGKFDARDQMERYVRWYRTGYMSSTGVCFDIGNTTRVALERFERTGEPFSGPTAANTAGNGSLMRLAPVPLALAHDPRLAITHAALSSKTTHGAAEAMDACRYMAGLVCGAIAQENKESLLSPMYAPLQAEGIWKKEPLSPRIASVASASFKAKSPPNIRGTGYVVESLEAALWAFSSTGTFGDGCLAAANLGDDADTTAAIYGQLAGAYYGVESIPAEWLDPIAMRGEIEGIADRLLALSGSEGSQDWLHEELTEDMERNLLRRLANMKREDDTREGSHER